jgi:hypothetical protein
LPSIVKKYFQMSVKGYRYYIVPCVMCVQFHHNSRNRFISNSLPPQLQWRPPISSIRPGPAPRYPSRRPQGSCCSLTVNALATPPFSLFPVALFSHQFQHIIVAIDGSHFGEAALHWALNNMYGEVRNQLLLWHGMTLRTMFSILCTATRLWTP